MEINGSMKVTPSITLAEKATRILRKFINDNYQDGGQLPGEHELSELLGVNRNTVRMALKVLEQEGVILRKRGSGTFVNKHVLGIRLRLDKFTKFSDVIHNAGYAPSRVQLDWDTAFASDEAARKLEVDVNALLVSSRLLFLADKKPAVYIHSYVPTKYIKGGEIAQSAPDSMFDFVADQCHTKIAYSTSEIIPRVVGGDYSSVLEMDPTSAILQLNEIHYSEEDYPIMLSDVFINDTIIRFHTVRLLS